MRKTSEWVSLGHPDKMADYVSSYILDRHLERDPWTRYAVECQIKDAFVTLAGEVTSRASFDDDALARHVRAALCEIGYTDRYALRWHPGDTVCGKDAQVTSYLSLQSPDIAQGVDRGGWGDQGIFFGMATTDEETRHLPKDRYLAELIGKHLFHAADTLGIGLDIKTQVETVDGFVTQVVVAAPTRTRFATESVECAVRNILRGGDRDALLVINGTGSFERHGPVADCGTTGRKLAVDFYGGNCPIGGGSPWTKDGSKADVALNLYARKIALKQMRRFNREVRVAISSIIGRSEIEVTVTDETNRELSSWTESRAAGDIVEELELRKPRFAKMCREGLFRFVDDNWMN